MLLGADKEKAHMNFVVNFPLIDYVHVIINFMSQHIHMPQLKIAK